MPNYQARINVSVDHEIFFEAESEEEAGRIAELAAQDIHSAAWFPTSIDIDGTTVEVSYDGPDNIEVTEEPWEE